MKTVIEMAREAGLNIARYESIGQDVVGGHKIEKLERFAALVREDFALKFSAEACGKCVIKQAYKDSEKELNALREISDKQGSFPEKNLSPVVCEHTNQSVTHYSNETWIQHCESCGVVIKSGTYINENGAVTNEVTTQQEPVAWSDDLDAMPFNAYCSAIVNWNSYSRDGDSFRKGTDVEVIVVKYKTNDGESAIEFLHTGDDQMLLTNCDVIKWKPLYTTPPTTAQEPRNFGIEMLKQYERGVKAGRCIAARQIAAEIADFCSDIDGGENMFSRAIRKKYGVG